MFTQLFALARRQEDVLIVLALFALATALTAQYAVHQ
jgi:hypothetical protein